MLHWGEEDCPGPGEGDEMVNLTAWSPRGGCWRVILHFLPLSARIYLTSSPLCCCKWFCGRARGATHSLPSWSLRGKAGENHPGREKPKIRGWWRNNRRGKITPWDGGMVGWAGLGRRETGGQGDGEDPSAEPGGRRAAAGLAGRDGVGRGKTKSKKCRSAIYFCFMSAQLPGYFP